MYSCNELGFVQYDAEATEYLMAKDRKLARAIEAVGSIRRPADGDVFASVVKSIVGQQISTSALKTVLGRLSGKAGDPLTPEAVSALGVDGLQSCGMTFRKAGYIKSFAEKVLSGAFDLDALEAMDDEEAIGALTSLKGVGRWTAEMTLIFSMNRMNVFAFDDVGILRGIRMVYHHRSVSRELFERYRRRFSPYCTVASLYFWQISHMDVPGYDRDYAPKKR
ncbi:MULTISPECIES: DNA-3-methyladenine glycosylase [unclassified Adlercreutzia]|uniref:DNA-3-methyladenine glycosylase family protein n=1 Tax=unclassified Adlercreutzia TaxID=2636013 RepID=UPI0013ED38C3|nr:MULTISPECIES: DNA-3-methyladenine glycosylase [unclassified Adlercreutzia]